MFCYWEFVRYELCDVYVLLKMLGDLYYSYFVRFYFDIKRGSFNFVRCVLEFLVVMFELLVWKEFFDIFRMNESILEEEYEF